MPDGTCCECGLPFTPRRNDQRYCAQACRDRAKERRRKLRNRRNCVLCGTEFTPWKKRAVYCSVACFNTTQGSKWVDATCVVCGAVTRRLKSNTNRTCGQPACVSWFLRRGVWPSEPVPWRECDWCGRVWLGGPARRSCSPGSRCFYALDRLQRGIPMASPVDIGDCRRCGEPFVRRYGQAGEFCSTNCAKRAKNSHERHVRRTLARSGERFTLREIAERDGWRCHLCGDKVPDRPYKARDKDPTIDHLVPVSKGGTHTRDNVALAHNRCNWERGDQGVAQLRLIA